MKHDPEYELARKRVRAKKDFYQHFWTFIAVSIFFFVLNLFTSPGAWWFHWPILGWGIAIGSHFFSTFGPGADYSSGEDKEESLILREIDMIRREVGRRYPGVVIGPDYSDTLLDRDKAERRPQKSRRQDWKDDDLV